jgi:hypothetical protein
MKDEARQPLDYAEDETIGARPAWKNDGWRYLGWALAGLTLGGALVLVLL